MISFVTRTYAWIVIFGGIGIANDAIVGLELSDTPVRLMSKERLVVGDTLVFTDAIRCFMNSPGKQSINFLITGSAIKRLADHE